MNNLRHSLLLQIHRQIRILRSLVRIVDSGESLDLSSSSLREQSLSIRLLTVCQRSGDVDEEEVSSVGSSGLLDNCSSGFSRVSVRSGRGSDDGGSGSGELGLVRVEEKREKREEEQGRERSQREEGRTKTRQNRTETRRLTATNPIRWMFLCRSSAENPSSGKRTKMLSRQLQTKKRERTREDRNSPDESSALMVSPNSKLTLRPPCWLRVT